MGLMRISKAGKSSKQSGFTLIELMVVMFLIAMTLGLVAPKIFSGLFSDEVKDSTRMIAGLLAEARNKALISRESHYLFFDFQRQTFWFTADANASQSLEGLDDDAGHPLEPVRLIDFQDNTGKTLNQGIVKIEFFPSGLVRPLLIHLSDDEADTRKTIRVKPFNHRLKIYDDFVYADEIYQDLNSTNQNPDAEGGTY